MNANRNIKIDFRINGKHDHYIESKHGKSIKNRPTKVRKTFKPVSEVIG